MSLSNFEVLSKIGEGAYSQVFRVRRIRDGKLYALKKVKILSLSEKERINSLNEVRILASVTHPNIISYKEAFMDEESSSLCIVMEYADAGDLYQRILEYQQKGRYMSESFIWTLVIQLSQALAALHSLSILHRDIKSANVFLYLDGKVKLGDLNVSKVAKQGLLHTQTGTPYYASPEVWKDLPYDCKSDIWSFGCVIYEAAALKPPFRAEDMQGLFKKVTKGEFTRLPRTFSQDLQSLIEQILNVDPLLRPSSENLLHCPQVEKRMQKFEELVVQEHTASTALLETIKFPRSFVHLSDRLPAPQYEEEGEKKEDLVLPKLIQEKREDSPSHSRFSRKLSTEKVRQQDRSENLSRDHKKILRENYGALKQLKMKNPYSRSTPLRQDDSKHAHELSLDSIRTRQSRNLSSNGRLISRQPLQDSYRSRLLKMLQLETSSRRLLPD